MNAKAARAVELLEEARAKMKEAGDLAFEAAHEEDGNGLRPTYLLEACGRARFLATQAGEVADHARLALRPLAQVPA